MISITRSADIGILFIVDVLAYVIRRQLLKFVISAVLAIIFLYFAITGTQNMMQAKEDLDLANERVDYWKGQVVKEHEFYRLHGCSKTGSESYSCPPGTPDFVPLNLNLTN